MTEEQFVLNVTNILLEASIQQLKKTDEIVNESTDFETKQSNLIKLKEEIQSSIHFRLTELAEGTDSYQSLKEDCVQFLKQLFEQFSRTNPKDPEIYEKTQAIKKNNLDILDLIKLRMGEDLSVFKI